MSRDIASRRDDPRLSINKNPLTTSQLAIATEHGMAPSTSKQSLIATSQQPRKRRADSDDEASNEPISKRSRIITTDTAKANIPQIRPVTRRISQSQIRDKWRPLPTVAQDRLRSLLKSSKRKVINRQSNETTRREAEVSLGSLLRKLEKQIPRMPFPKGTSKSGEDFDKATVAEVNSVLEMELTKIMGSVELLKNEIGREEEECDADRRLLQKLERDVESEEREHAKKSKKTHPLLREVDRENSPHDSAVEINLVDGDDEAEDWEDVLDDDEELAPVLAQLRNHLDSIENNRSQVAGIQPLMVASEAALGNMFHQTGKKHAKGGPYSEGLQAVAGA